ncbi:energy transducer TonB [Roseobacter weihaiensis]|uniref:energy transducer TonB n=1 Tax=Roseobacter weihaiensis TaxID=2763262 RepID=UPI001D0B1D5B|nr:energy transducer TonB [Roseobacter sp. H9]
MRLTALLTGRIGRRAVHTGHYISGAGHLFLLGFMVFGDVFASEPLPFEATDVSVISSAEYEALVAAGQPPEQATEVAQPADPEIVPETPDLPTPPEEQTELVTPAPTQTPDVETPPDVSEIDPLPPPADISDQAPVLDQPSADIAVLVPEVSDQPVPQAADRVAPEAVAPPEPEAIPDPVEQEAVTPDAAGEVEQDPSEATAPEAAATEIVTEAEEPARAPEQSRRPPARRPEAPVQTAATPPAPAETPSNEDAVTAALQEALTADSDAPAAPQGPPLSAGEKESLRVAVSSCWNVGSLSTDALGTTVVVEVSMSQDGRPITGSIRMASSSGGSEVAARQAFEAARRAIIRCGARGFELPVEKYSQWQEIEMTFNPERMRVK